ncbi:glyoxalase-like protein [Tamaricihabitans halophyticus]|uniref:Glyoxalase-like protein n=1 Tax=Tamaricihabitans halophyticus TaxID=1262583 RepID=A0A4R2QSR6_9PSEU|nr:VOC family protein [Tamaricihabitans halophyticus]TCP50045.1 glyoxalase-like protein [Tamaricihabitans halophyticus]
MSEHSAAFDHLIHWVDDLEAARSAYDEAGFPIQATLTMPGFRNAAWGVDDERYVELATVDDWEAVASSKYAAGLQVLRPAIESRPASGLVTFAVDVPDVRATAARLREAGHDVAEVEVRFEERNAGFVEVFVLDLPSYFPFFISYDPPRAEIGRMRAEYRAAEGITFDGRPELTALLVRSNAPEADARRLAELTGCDVHGLTVALPGAEVRFQKGTPAGLYGIAVHGLDPATAPGEVAGMTVHAEA